MDTLAARFKLIVLPRLSISLFLLPFLQATDFNYCDKKGNYVVKVKGVDISPNPWLEANQPPSPFQLLPETSCPVAVGNFVLSHNQVLPVFTPPRSYTLKMTISGEGIQVLTCISFNFKIGFGAYGSSVSDS
ncbi:MD-2-related lipid recognition domain-containing protein [Hibiscus syriacus]|uniref:MD-2-related lipid recognition domain-containing protein n=1 Tax=Hibiscus syriacus TaxID=106335 RepID=A0A6A3D2G9_HIBSY|nr:MD-2-related lipid recognition domain-containing protein [Hibiscus syriacus]